MKKILAAGVILAATAMTSYHAIAASDGVLGATSTGTAVVTLTIPERFQISDMNDIALGSYGGAGDLTGNDDICVYHNGDGSYQVTITDNSALTVGFAVEDAANTVAIPMQVRWNDQTGTAGNAAVTYNTPLVSTGANTSTTDCSVGGLSANLEVTLLEADLQAAPAAAYDSTLTLIVEPD